MNGSLSLIERPLNLIQPHHVTASTPIASADNQSALSHRDNDIKSPRARDNGAALTQPPHITARKHRPTALVPSADIIDLCSDDDESTSAPQPLSSSDSENQPPTQISSPEFLSSPSTSTTSSSHSPPPPSSTSMDIDAAARQRKRSRTGESINESIQSHSSATAEAVRTAVTVAAALHPRKLSPPKPRPAPSMVYGWGEQSISNNVQRMSPPISHLSLVHSPPLSASHPAASSSHVVRGGAIAIKEFDDEEDDDISRFHAEFHSQDGPQNDEMSDDEGDEESPHTPEKVDGASERTVRETIYISSDDELDESDDIIITAHTSQRSDIASPAAMTSRANNVVDNSSYPLANMSTTQRTHNRVSPSQPPATSLNKTPAREQTQSANRPALAVINVGPPLESIRVVYPRGYTLTATPFRTLYTAEPIINGAVGRIVKSKRFRYNVNQLRRRLDEIEDAIADVDEKMETADGDVSLFHNLTDELVDEQEMIQDEIADCKKKANERKRTERRLWKEYERRSRQRDEHKRNDNEDFASEDNNRSDEEDEDEDDEDDEDDDDSSDDDVVEVGEAEEAENEAADALMDDSTDAIINPAKVCSKFRDLLASNDYYYHIDNAEFNQRTAEISRRAEFGPTLFDTQTNINNININQPSRRVQPTQMPADGLRATNILNASATAPDVQHL